MLDREGEGREASPSAAVIDSQSVKAPFAERRGFDAGKKIDGRERHIAVDTEGRLLMVDLTAADISDSAGAQAILDGIRKRLAPAMRRAVLAAGAGASKQLAVVRAGSGKSPPIKKCEGDNIEKSAILRARDTPLSKIKAKFVDRW